MPDKHEVGGSTPLEPTSRQCRRPVIGELKAESENRQRTKAETDGKISEGRQKRRRGKTERLYKRISEFGRETRFDLSQSGRPTEE